MKDIGHKWYILHSTSMILAGILGTVSLIVILLYQPPPHFVDAHRVIGLILTLGMLLQIGLGFIINKLFQVGRKNVPWHDVLHWWIGYN